MMNYEENERISYYENLFNKNDLVAFNGTDLLSHSSKFAKIEEHFFNKHKDELIPQKIAVLASYTSHHFIRVLKLFLYQRGIRPIFYEGEYDSIAMELMDKNSGLYNFKPEVILLLTYHTDIKEYPKLYSREGDIEQWIQEKIDYYKNLWHNASSISGCQIFQTTFVSPKYRPLGNLEINYLFTPSNCIKRLNLELIRNKPSNVTFIDMEYLASYYGKRDWFDDSNYYLSKQGFSFDAFGLISHALSRILAANTGKIKKCLVLDLDNTLWGGVIGDDGVEGINLNPSHAVGEAFIGFQHYVKKLKERGVILAVCSKNDESDAKLPFENHPDMVITMNDISCFIANWDDKPSNLRNIASQLNIGLDSIVFFDDNPVERDMVKQFIPEIEVIDVPTDPAYYIDALYRAMCFEWPQLTEEDLTRTESFVCERKRTELSLQAEDYDGYLKSLEMKVTIGYVTPMELSRFTQLINKTNQFNLRTQRYSEAAVSQMMQDRDRYALIHISLEDKFSKYGIISCVIVEKMDAIAFINTWLMSCRVLKRGIENVVFQEIIRIARSWNCEYIVGEYIPSKKNGMVAGLYEKFGFKQAPQNSREYTLKTDSTSAIYRLDPALNHNVFHCCAIENIGEK
jgi:FkbH-like protein